MDAARNLRRTRDRLHLYRACGGEPPRNHAPDIAAMDLFVAPTIGFDLLYVLAVIRLERRNLVWINVTPNPSAEWVARQRTRRPARSMPLEFDKDEAVAGEQQRPDLCAVQLLRSRSCRNESRRRIKRRPSSSETAPGCRGPDRDRTAWDPCLRQFDDAPHGSFRIVRRGA
jgi:hypothetical protein